MEFVPPLLAWEHARKIERKHTWKCMDMSGDQWKGRRMISFMVHIYSSSPFRYTVMSKGTSMLIPNFFGNIGRSGKECWLVR